MPILAGATSAQGVVTDFVSDYLFNITSFTLAPELDSGSGTGGVALLLSLLAMTVGARRSR
jgi:hypothetical protein